jgi:hypothetical protein
MNNFRRRLYSFLLPSNKMLKLSLTSFAVLAESDSSLARAQVTYPLPPIFINQTNVLGPILQTF